MNLPKLFETLKPYAGKFYVNENGAIRSRPEADLDPEEDGYEYCPLAAYATVEFEEHYGNLPVGDWKRYAKEDLADIVPTYRDWWRFVKTADGKTKSKLFDPALRKTLEAVLVEGHEFKQ